MDFPTSSELFELAARKVVATNPKILESVARQSGTTVNSMLQAGGLMGSSLVGKIVEAYSNSKISTAKGAALRELVFDWFGLIPFGANPAVVPISLMPSGVKTGTIGVGTILTTPTGIQFQTLESVTWAASSASQTVNCQAVLAGPTGNVGPGQINAFKTAPAFDTNMTVLQANYAVGGSVAETDDQLKARAKGFWSAARRGTIGAIEYGAKMVPGVVNAKAIESDVYVGSTLIPQSKIVTLYASDINGRSNTIFKAAVQSELENWRPCGVYVAVESGRVVFLPIDISVSYVAGTDTVAAQKKVIATILAYMDELRYGQKMDLGAIEDRVRRIEGVSTTVPPRITAPTGDQIPNPDDILKTRESMITINRR